MTGKELASETKWVWFEGKARMWSGLKDWRGRLDLIDPADPSHGYLASPDDVTPITDPAQIAACEALRAPETTPAHFVQEYDA